MMTSPVCLMTCVLTVLLPLTIAYSTGPPVGVIADICDTMQPQHDVEPQNAGYPFEIITSGTCYKPGMPIPVVVRVNATQMAPHAQPYYEGLFVMARETNGMTIVTTSNEGTFTVPTPNNITTYNCYEKQNSAVGHKKSQHWPCRSFNWTAPTGLTKDITFHGTIARNKEKYWMNVRSETLKYDADCSMPSQIKCEGDLLDEEDSGEKDPAASGSDVIRVTTATSVLVALTAFVMN